MKVKMRRQFTLVVRTVTLSTADDVMALKQLLVYQDFSILLAMLSAKLKQADVLPHRL
jgi:hypothetical protein